MSSSPHDYWTGRCHLSATSPGARRWAEDADEAVTVVVVLAESEDAMRERLLQRLREEGLELRRLEAGQTLLQRFRKEGMSKTLLDLADKTTSRTPVALGEMIPILPGPAAIPEAPRQAAPPVGYAELAWPDLFTPTSPPLWAVIDGVNCRDVMERLGQADVQSGCPYATTDATTRAIAPWLVRLEPDSEIRQWLEGLPQDQHWGILLQSHATLKQLRAHLRKFTMLWTPANDQAPVYFRFYDPRVALDMSQALGDWKLAAFMAPLESLIVGLSPLMNVPDTASLAGPPYFASTAQEVQGRLLRLSLGEAYRCPETPSRGFAIGQAEFSLFGALQKARASRALARELKARYADTPLEALLAVVEAAGKLGQRNGMTSEKQITTLAKCILEFGQDFPHEYQDAKSILGHPSMLAWQKRKLIEEWIPRGRIRRDFLKRQAHTGVTPGAWVESP